MVNLSCFPYKVLVIAVTLDFTFAFKSNARFFRSLLPFSLDIVITDNWLNLHPFQNSLDLSAKAELENVFNRFKQMKYTVTVQIDSNKHNEKRK